LVEYWRSRGIVWRKVFAGGRLLIRWCHGCSSRAEGITARAGSDSLHGYNSQGTFAIPVRIWWLSSSRPGKEGWELVAAYTITFAGIPVEKLYLKRPG
jgi:hypothetical protein